MLIYSLVGYAKIFKSANIFLILKFCLQLWKPPFHYCKRSFEVLHERWKFHLYLHNFKLIFKILRLLQISKKLDRIKCLMSWTATSQKEIPNAQYTYEKMPNFFFFSWTKYHKWQYQGKRVWCECPFNIFINDQSEEVKVTVLTTGADNGTRIWPQESNYYVHWM